MGMFDFLDERPLEPADAERVHRALAGVVDPDRVLVQVLGVPGATFLGALRVLDLRAGDADRHAHAALVEETLQAAGYEAKVRSRRDAWPDVEVQRLRVEEWRRRREGAAGPSGQA